MFDFPMGGFVAAIAVIFGVPLCGLGILVGWLLWG
jgi:hypothetical protein